MKTTCRGNLLVEFVLVAVLSGFMMVGILLFHEIFRLKNEMIDATRVAAYMAANGWTNEEAIRTAISSVLESPFFQRDSIVVARRPFRSTPASRFYRLSDVQVDVALSHPWLARFHLNGLKIMDHLVLEDE